MPPGSRFHRQVCPPPWPSRGAPPPPEPSLLSSGAWVPEDPCLQAPTFFPLSPQLTSGGCSISSFHLGLLPCLSTLPTPALTNTSRLILLKSLAFKEWLPSSIWEDENLLEVAVPNVTESIKMVNFLLCIFALSPTHTRTRTRDGWGSSFPDTHPLNADGEIHVKRTRSHHKPLFIAPSAPANLY